MTRRRKQPTPAPQRVRNAIGERYSGAGSQYDYGTQRTPGLSAWASPMQQDQIALALYQSDWQASKIINIPVDDMLRDGWGIAGLLPAQTEALEAAQESLGALAAFRQAKRLERLLGGAAIYLGAIDGNADPAAPLGDVQRGGLRFLSVIPRSRVQRVDVCTDPLQPGYGRPERYTIEGKQVHRSRLIVFNGDPLLPAGDALLGINTISRNDGFGQSKLTAIFDDLTRATGSRQAAFQLVERAGIFFAHLDLTDLQGTKEGEAKVQAMRDVVNQINAYRGAVFDRQPGDSGTPPISSITPNFGSVPELVMSFLQVLSAASDIPATRFLGQAPGGLNATGEADLENYYGRLEGEQRQTLTPQIKQFLAALTQSVLGQKLPVEVTFEPLWSLSAKEVAETRSTDATALVTLSDGGIITTDEAHSMAIKREIIEEPEDQLDDAEPVDPVQIEGEVYRLNGAQIASAIEVSSNVAAGTISQDAGVALIRAMGVNEADARAMVGGISPTLATVADEIAGEA